MVVVSTMKTNRVAVIAAIAVIALIIVYVSTRAKKPAAVAITEEDKEVVKKSAEEREDITQEEVDAIMKFINP